MIRKMLSVFLLSFMIVMGNIGLVAAAPDACSDNNPATPCNVLDPGCHGVSDSTLCGENGKNQTYADNGLFGVNGILNKAANFLLVIVGIAGVFMVVIGGVQYALSGGDPQKINKAKDMIIYAIVGLIVALVAKGIIAFVINRVA